MTLPLSRVTAAAPTALTGANWSYTSTTTTATTVTHTFSYAATVPGFGNTGGMSFKVLLVAPPGTGISISAVGSAPGAGSTSVSFVSGG